MKWSHLPVQGGLYDQDPMLLDRWRYLFMKRAEYENEKREADERKNRSQMGRSRMRPSRAR